MRAVPQLPSEAPFLQAEGFYRPAFTSKVDLFSDEFSAMNYLKKKMEVFCSFHYDQLSGASSPGAQALKGFLEFSHTGRLPSLPSETGRGPDSPFEVSVARAIEALGYKVIHQVGTAGYFIDLGVCHPTIPGKFILAVECDGATYHSSRSARDRDRLRQQNLENLGWKIHRIWSTDWFKSERREIARLKAKLDYCLGIEGLRPASGDQTPTLAPQVSTIMLTPKIDLSEAGKERLRRSLISLREQAIKPQFPGIPPEHGILRKAILDLVVELAPTTAEEFDRSLREKRLSFANEHARHIRQIIELVSKEKSRG